MPGIGDALMATPMIKQLKGKFPNAQIDIACMFKPIAYVFKNNKNIHDIHFLPIFDQRNRLISIYHLLKLRRNNYDVSILAFPTYRREYHYVQFMVGAKKRISHRYKKGYVSERHFLNTSLVPVEEEKHNVENNLFLLKALHLNPRLTNLKYDLKLDQEDEKFGKEYIQKLGWQNNSVIAIHPGSIDSAAGMMKRWSITKYAEVAKYLITKKHKVVVFVGPSEMDIGKKLVKRINNKNAILIEGINFQHALGVLSQVDLLISNDNGFSHLSNALKVKSIVLFGPTNVSWCSPIDKKYSISIRKAKFEPWFRNDMKVTHPPKGVKSGMDQITVNDVIKTYNDLLTKKNDQVQ